MSEADKQSKLARRNLLKSMAAGGVVTTAVALPAKWSKPVVDTVMLPAHATTTGNRIVGGGGGGGGVAMLAPLSGLVQEAHAGIPTFGGCISISYQSDGPNIDDVSNVVVDVLNVDCNEYEKVLCVDVSNDGPLDLFVQEAVAGGDSMVWEYQVTIAQSQPMTKTGTFNWETVVIDGGRSYTVELTFTTHTASTGQKFGDCTISKAWGIIDAGSSSPIDHLVAEAHAGSGGYTYETFPLVVGATCPIVDDCLDPCIPEFIQEPEE